MERRTRIVATLGPATDRPGVFETILEAGLDVVRINFSHGDAEEHKQRAQRVREMAAKRQRPLAILGDLPGPKLRALLTEPMDLAQGQPLTLSRTNVNSGAFSLTEPELLDNVSTGHRVLLDDGRMMLRVKDAKSDSVEVEVEVGGTLLPNKGVNLPDTELSVPAVTERDKEALAIAAEIGVDWLALSFVRTANAADQLREHLRQLGMNVPIIAKMERPEAVENHVEIIRAFDGIMVARGDLGVEIPLERVPNVQKTLIGAARSAGKPVITATDMLDSMRNNPRPTRAEASDVANAVYDGSDGIMLSGETAIGKYPVEAVRCMDRIARETETHIGEEHWREVFVPRGEIRDQFTHSTCELAFEINADAIITPTYSGRTARMIARHRPAMKIIAPTPSEAVYRQLAMSWGVTPVLFLTKLNPGDGRIEASVQAAVQAGAVSAGQRAIILAGHPFEGGEELLTIRAVTVGSDGRSHSPEE